VACNLFTCVDDEHVTGPDKDLTCQASHTLASKQSYLGIQDTGRRLGHAAGRRVRGRGLLFTFCQSWECV
jgi:hypothetical protein